jgi:hypothetical protein
MLGIRPHAPRGLLYVDPALPDWMPDVTLIDLRLGQKMIDLRFWRDGAETKFEALSGDETCVVLKPISHGLDFEAHLKDGA